MESTLYLSCCSFLNFVKIWTKLVGFLHYFQVFMRYLPFHNFESISFNLMGSRLYLIFVGNGCRWRNQLIAGVGLGTNKKVGDPRWVQIKSWRTPLTFKPQLFHSCPMDWDFLFFSLKKKKHNHFEQSRWFDPKDTNKQKGRTFQLSWTIYYATR
jgi:hypothetical protein